MSGLADLQAVQILHDARYDEAEQRSPGTVQEAPRWTSDQVQRGESARGDNGPVGARV